MARPAWVPFVRAAAASLVLAGCASLPPVGGPALEGTDWSLVALGDTAPPALPLPRIPRLMLADGRVAGTSGCNRLAGTYTRAQSSLRFGAVAGTRMMCADGMEVERDFLAMLEAVAGWRVQSGQLELLDAAGQPLARFGSNLRSYTCGDLGTVHVRYEGEGADARATLALGGREYQLRAAPAASGARYVVEQGRRPDMSMEWHTRGDEGLLLEAPLSDSRGAADLVAFGRCRAG